MFYICRESNEEKEREYNLMREEIYRELFLARYHYFFEKSFRKQILLVCFHECNLIQSS